LSAAGCEYGTMLEISQALRRLRLAADWKVRAPPPSLTHHSAGGNIFDAAAVLDY
jgi:hypothetical protein